MNSVPTERDGDEARRPRLLFIRPRTEGLPSYIANHFVEQNKCLGLHFDVTVAPPEGDYRAFCEAFQPDLVVFESGVYVKQDRPIRNTDAFPEIPKLGFLHSDANCPTRRVFLADMERWGVDTFFTLSVSMAGYMPEIADRLFVWPNSIDPSVYRDYGGPKAIPVLTAGSRAMHYPWRNAVLDRLSRNYPSLNTPHFGWFDASKTARMAHGEEYARLINLCLVAPTCGTVANEVVRKHFEIPGAGTLLATERTAGLVEAGFVDMENCVFVDPDNVLDKLDHLFANRDLLQAITERGHALVHERHTWRNRDQIRQWFELNRQRRPGQRIVQAGPFGGLALVGEDSPARNGHVDPMGRDLLLLGQAWGLYDAREYAAAERVFTQCANFHPWTPEPHLGLALIDLQRGHAEPALIRLQGLVDNALRQHADSPDPVEWAYLLTALLCLGREREAAARAKLYPHLDHPQLSWVRRAVAVVANEPNPLGGTGRPGRLSVHRSAAAEADWFAEFDAFLRHCDRAAMADRLAQVRGGAVPARSAASVRKPAGGAPPQGPMFAAPKDSLGQKLRRHAIRALTDLDYPRQMLAARGKPSAFAAEVKSEAIRSEVRSVLLVADHPWSLASEALHVAIRENPGFPTLLRAGPAGSLAVLEPVSDSSHATPPVGVDRLSELMRARSLTAFDLVVIDGAAPPGFEDEALLTRAETIVLDRLQAPTNHLIARRLLTMDAGYQLTTSGAGPDGGYAVFRRVAAAPAASAPAGAQEACAATEKVRV